MKQYWCFVYVRFKKPVIVPTVSGTEAFRADGYWNRLGITANSITDLRKQVQRKMRPEGRIHWRRSFYHRIRYYDLGLSIAPKGVWYSGGRVYITL